MRTHPDDLTLRVIDLATTHLRAPAQSWTDTDTGPVLVFEPALTAQEQTTYATLVALARSAQPMTPSLYDAMRPDIQVLRTFRQRSRNDFIALSQNDRDRALYDAIVATTKLFLAILREPE